MSSRDFDLNSLLILNAVIECRGVTAAAKKMSMSPSSVTYAINKIRRMTSNPIFTRSKSGIVPTTLAMELNQRYIKAMSLIHDGLDFSKKIKEDDVLRTITISTYTFMELWMSYAACSKEKIMGGISFNFVNRPGVNDNRIAKLRNHEIDIDIGGLLPNDASIISQKLFSSPFKALVSNNHPTIKDKLTLNDWNESKHVKWVLTDDETLNQSGDANIVNELTNRNVEICSASSINSFMICALSDYIMLVPEYLESFLGKILPVKFFDLPFQTTMTSTVFVHYHRSARRKQIISKCLSALDSISSQSVE
ncbi:LysR family transcriptional regulator [Buttiauxella sp. B2]|uniref:LysR family transcriptional regulator n=1 Tax=Buttiauxella sp. B2 TaxID=2587812 RepID=UPI00167408B0|nr:LysR family transcriptional regulator [Buttiauxella sp. B2]